MNCPQMTNSRMTASRMSDDASPANAARRRNAALSTGPKTPKGKVNSSLNALKHGLAVSSYRTPRWRDRIETLTQALYRDAIQRLGRLAGAGLQQHSSPDTAGRREGAGKRQDNEALQTAARRIAEAQVDIERAREVRQLTLLDAQRALPVVTSRDIKNALEVALLDQPRTRKRVLSCLHLMNCKPDLSGVYQLEDIAIAGGLLNSIERYEARALSRLKTASRALDILMEEFTLDALRPANSIGVDGDGMYPGEAGPEPRSEAWMREVLADFTARCGRSRGGRSLGGRSPGVASVDPHASGLGSRASPCPASSPYGSLSPSEPRHPSMPGLMMLAGTSSLTYPRLPAYHRRGTGPSSRHAHQTGHTLAVWPIFDPAQELLPDVRPRRVKPRKGNGKRSARSQAPSRVPTTEELMEALERGQVRSAERRESTPSDQLPTDDERIGHGRGEPHRGGSTTIDDERLARRPDNTSEKSRRPVDDERIGRRPGEADHDAHRQWEIRTASPPASRPVDPNGFCGHGTLQDTYLSRRVIPLPTYSDEPPRRQGSASTSTTRPAAPDHGEGTLSDPYIRRRT